jgi:hypothetical protein
MTELNFMGQTSRDNHYLATRRKDCFAVRENFRVTPH